MSCKHQINRLGILVYMVLVLMIFSGTESLKCYTGRLADSVSITLPKTNGARNPHLSIIECPGSCFVSRDLADALKCYTGRLASRASMTFELPIKSGNQNHPHLSIIECQGSCFESRDAADVREVFDLFDFWDGRDGLIGAEKVGDLLRCLGLNPTISLVKKHGGTDKPGEKQFSFEEFLPIVKSILKVEDIGTFAEFSEAFKSFDREGMGYITAGEMNYMLTAMGERLTDAETDEIMRDTDTTPDLEGNLKYEDFIKKVLKGPATGHK